MIHNIPECVLISVINDGCHRTPTYLGVKLDRTRIYREHLTALRGKVMARTALIRRLAGTSWGASTVVPVMNGHPQDQAKVSVHCRWPLVTGTDGQAGDAKYNTPYNTT